MTTTLLESSPFAAYSYAYPHKTAYRPFARPVRLDTLWAGEARDALFLYVHVPFCEFRCGFCNLFTQANPREGVAARYLDTLERQVERVGRALGKARLARFAIGGGTPTHLEVAELARVFELARLLGTPLGQVPVSVELSPDTTTDDKVALLRERGVTRASLGVQTFVEAEALAVSRPQKTATVERALERLKAARFPVVNVDLIYGLPHQTRESWLGSIDRALAFVPEELFLYPLYVRPLTGLGLSDREWDDERLALYRAGRDHLLERGYEQVSLRLFRTRAVTRESGPVYCCQEDGMVGLGCGARSYTRSLHYSGEYAVGARGVREILESWIALPTESFDVASYGFELDPEDQRRRYAIQSLLQRDGLSLDAWRQRFGTDALDDLPQLAELEPLGWANQGAGKLALTPDGLERSDAIGPWLYSEKVRQLSGEYILEMSPGREPLSILYRGPLESCNYGCDYCPFAKKVDSHDDQRRDRESLECFVNWVSQNNSRTISVFFTPWGEALVRRWSRDAIVRLTALPHVARAAIQTNLSAGLDWLDDADPAKVGLWATFHPTEVSRARFVERCHEALARGARLSAGVVGLREHFAEIEALRRELPPEVYVWINAYKRTPNYYTTAEYATLEAIDPHFRTNTVYHASLGRSCRTGQSVISVDGEGNVRRCHFVKELIGNIYDRNFEACLQERPCPNATCGCHIGYVHLEHLKQDEVYGEGILERIPRTPGP